MIFCDLKVTENVDIWFWKSIIKFVTQVLNNTNTLCFSTNTKRA